MELRKILRFKKSRKYPIKRDEYGLSLRARCFVRFDEGKRPVVVAEELGMKDKTAYRYFQDWKKIGSNFEKKYKYFSDVYKASFPDREWMLELTARTCGISIEELETILSQPHGLRRMMTGKFTFPINEDVHHKLKVAFEIGFCISNHLIDKRGKYEDVLYAFNKFMEERKNQREEEEASIKEENKEIEFIRKVIEADVKIEQEKGPKHGRLTEKEINRIFKWWTDAKAKELEAQYWILIYELTAGGLTMQQAREKLIQNRIDKGDLEGAKWMRAYQDIVNPLKTD